MTVKTLTVQNLVCRNQRLLSLAALSMVPVTHNQTLDRREKAPSGPGWTLRQVVGALGPGAREFPLTAWPWLFILTQTEAPACYILAVGNLYSHSCEEKMMGDGIQHPWGML